MYQIRRWDIVQGTRRCYSGELLFFYPSLNRHIFIVIHNIMFVICLCEKHTYKHTHTVCPRESLWNNKTMTIYYYYFKRHVFSNVDHARRTSNCSDNTRELLLFYAPSKDFPGAYARVYMYTNIVFAETSGPTG